MAERSSQCIVAVTHVRNILATPTILENSDRTQVPVSGGPPTGSIVVLEKEDHRWNMRIDGGPEMHIPEPISPIELAS